MVIFMIKLVGKNNRGNVIKMENNQSKYEKQEECKKKDYDMRKKIIVGGKVGDCRKKNTQRQWQRKREMKGAFLFNKARAEGK